MAKPWLSDLLGKATDTQPAEKVAHLPVSSDKLLKQISELQGRLVQEQCEEGKIERAREEALADLAELIAVSKQKQVDIQEQLDELRGRLVAIVQQAGIRAEVVRR
jgi:hypothetical protein